MYAGDCPNRGLSNGRNFLNEQRRIIRLPFSSCGNAVDIFSVSLTIFESARIGRFSGRTASSRGIEASPLLLLERNRVECGRTDLSQSIGT